MKPEDKDFPAAAHTVEALADHYTPFSYPHPLADDGSQPQQSFGGKYVQPDKPGRRNCRNERIFSRRRCR